MNQRCKKIINILNDADRPITASNLAEGLSVTRQVIVGDVALIRASGIEITATSRGYVMNNRQTGDRFPYVGMLTCRHTSEQIKDELYTIVDNGATVIDVTIEHAIYGELSGKLNLSSRYDVDAFIRKVDEDKHSAPISILTGGIHLHRIGCRDRETFDRISDELERQGILYH